MTSPETIVRQCGACTLCCRLVPVAEIKKPSNTRCQFQMTGKGCRLYHKPRMPISCRLWSCAWLAQPETTRDLRRPDRAHYVIDTMPDFVEARDGGEGESVKIPVIQIWVDAKHPDAHRDPALRAWLTERGRDGYAALIRYSGSEGFFLCPPAMSPSGDFIEARSNARAGPGHTMTQIADALGKEALPYEMVAINAAEAAAERGQ